MSENQLSKEIFEIYNKLGNNEGQPIDGSVVKEAVSVINNRNAVDSSSLFLLLSALNLLNAAIKSENYKSQLHYDFIKTKVSKIADSVLSNPDAYVDSLVFYDNVHKCLYFEVFGVIFSFHQVLETKLMKNVPCKTPIKWTGVRLQRIAQEIYQLAKSTYTNETAITGGPKTNSENGIKKLIECPDCNHEISKTALFCPYCGRVPNDSIITNGYHIGDRIQVNYNVNKISGDIVSISPIFLKIKSNENGIITVRQSSIDSIQALGCYNNRNINNISLNDIKSSLSTTLIVDSFDALLANLFPILSINNKTLIPTNAIVREINDSGIMITSDTGKTEVFRGVMVNYRKKTCSIGARIYCNRMSGDDSLYSIQETTFHEVMNTFRKALLYRKGVTPKRKKIMLAIMKFMMDEMTSKKEAYTEIVNFHKDFLSYLGENTLFVDEEKSTEGGTEFSNTVDESDNIEIVQPISIYKTETEKILEDEGLPKLKVLGKIDLDSIPGKKNLTKSYSSENNTTNLSKPLILSSGEVQEFLKKELTILSETKCKQIEKELDTLIRNGEKEECLRRSYQIINTRRPTPKYLRSYLDRIVNTEIALGHVSKALQSLAFLIVLTEQQDGANANGISHLYVTMARLYNKEQNREEALKAILYAESIKPNNNAINKLKDSILQTNGVVNENIDNVDDNQISQKVIFADSDISEMLLEDVRQEAHRQELLPAVEVTSAAQLFINAQKKIIDTTDSYEDKALLYLEAAAACYNTKQTSTIMFQKSVAHYARLKGHGMYARFANLIRNNSGEIKELQAFQDSACSYYVEALRIFNILGENDFLRDLLLKYLQLTFVISQIEGSKTPDSDWEDIQLGKLQEICLKGDSAENLNLLLRAYLVVGSAAEDVWDSLINDKGGIGPFRGRCSDSDNFKEQAYKSLNIINQSQIDHNLGLEDFMHNLFAYRNDRKNSFANAIRKCLAWKFNSFDLSSFDEKWGVILEFKDLITNTDLLTLDAFNSVIEILKPYAGRKENERTRLLVRSQQILLNTQKIISETTTYYGKTFFSGLIDNWLKEISIQLEERDASTLPLLVISCAPSYITKDENGNGVINIVITNNGDSTAQSFRVDATVNGREYHVTHDKELSSGDCCGACFISKDFANIESVNVHFKLTAKYQGKDLKPIECQATYEIEGADVLSDEIEIPWTISNTPEEHIFKGRDKELNTLINHYLSKDRSLTYILYGLTRTGKSSILDYLRNRIMGQPLKEEPNKKILAFKWYLNEFPYKNSTSSQFWTWALETNIYNELSDDLADEIDASYGADGLPPAEKISQLDFIKIVDVLNENNIIPFITIDEFSFIRLMLKEGLIDATFVSTLRNLALKGKACFIYSGTYDIKDLPKEKEYIAGQMNNTLPMPINQIDEQYADELIDACPRLIFDDKAKSYIRALSGCVPYWIQWICLACGKYAVANKHRHLGFNEVNNVIKVLTGEVEPGKKDTWESMDETNFHNNQIDPNNIAEHQLISSISYLNRESTQIERGISIYELKHLWDKYSVSEEKRLNMTRALTSLKDKKILYSFTDEGREVYRLSVDLFRRWWLVHHRDLDLEFSL